MQETGFGAGQHRLQDDGAQAPHGLGLLYFCLRSRFKEGFEDAKQQEGLLIEPNGILLVFKGA